MPTVREIANYAGVSKSTVSLVLNNKPGVSDQMRQAVLEAADALRVREDLPDSPAEKPLSIVVLHPPVLRSSEVFSAVLQGIQQAAGHHQLQLQLVTNDPQAMNRHVARLYFSDPNLYPDGVLIFGAQRHEPVLEQIQSLKIPCVVLGRNACEYPVSGIGRDEARHARCATEYLIDAGHRHIGVIGGTEAYDFVQSRRQGVLDALAHAGITHNPAWIQAGDGATATRNLLDAAPDITAILFINDSFAAEGLPVLREQNITIPDDISVISFDDTTFAQTYDPPLTSISYDHQQEGKRAVRMLIEQIRYSHIEAVYTIFSADLIKRASTGSAPV